MEQAEKDFLDVPFFVYDTQKPLEDDDRDVFLQEAQSARLVCV